MEDERKRFALHLSGQIIGTLTAFAIGYATKCDSNSGYAFIMVLIFAITQCHNIYIVIDYLSRRTFKNEGVDGFTSSKEKEALNKYASQYAILFTTFAVCHIAMAIYCVYFS